jgi:hypothetical protein
VGGWLVGWFCGCERGVDEVHGRLGCEPLNVLDD